MRLANYLHQMTTFDTGKRLLLAAILAGSVLAISGMTSMQPALAAKDTEKNENHNDSDRKNIPRDFDIKKASIDKKGNLVMKVTGTAGGTIPEKPAAGEFGQVFVYVFHTDVGIWVINAHWECHIGLVCDPAETMISEWHSETVTVGHVDGFDNPCVTSIPEERPATMRGHEAKVSVPEAHKIFKAETASFDLKTDPMDPTQECIAELHTVFDTWTPGHDDE